MSKICCITTLETTMREFVVPAMELFVNEGHDVTLMCDMSDGFIKEFSDRFRCVNINMHKGIRIKDFITKPIEFYKKLKQGHFDYVQYATTNASIYSCVPAWLVKIPHRVCCMWGIGFYSKKGINRFLYRQIEKFPCRFANHVSIPSFKNQQLGASYGLYKLSHSSVVGDGGTVGVDFNVFDIDYRKSFRKEVFSEYPQLKDKLVFGYLGRIYKDKGVNELLEAFMSLNEQNKYALLLVGSFDLTRQSLNQAILDKAKKQSNIIFHGHTQEVPKFLSAIDILCHPSYHEGFSMAIQQAMAMGCAILTTDIPGPSEVIENGISGLTVPSKNATALAEGMRMMANNELRESFTEASLSRVRSKFSRERMTKLTYENRKDIIDGKFDNL